MKSLVKGLDSPDVVNLGTLDGKHAPDDFGIFVELSVGPAEGHGEELFGVMVCSPAWLAREARKGPVVGRHHIFFERWDLTQIERELRRLFEIEGPDWHTIGVRLARIGHWEFEDYKEKGA